MNKMKMNKKGFLLGEETLKIIIAVICIVFLIFLLVSLWRAHIRNKELEQAKASLRHLIERINARNEEARIYNPVGWGVASFKKESEEIPEECLNKGWESCICICLSPTGAVHTVKNACNQKGICLESDYVVKGGAGNDIEIKPPLVLSIDYENKVISEKIEIKTGGEEFGGAGAGRDIK